MMPQMFQGKRLSMREFQLNKLRQKYGKTKKYEKQDFIPSLIISDVSKDFKEDQNLKSPNSTGLQDLEKDLLKDLDGPSAVYMN